MTSRHESAPRRLVDCAREFFRADDPSAKPLSFYELYERYFADFAARRVALLELGVRAGISIKVWSTCFPDGVVIGVDLGKHGVPDFSAFPNVVFVKSDQADAAQIEPVLARHAPTGLDVVIDDASHTALKAEQSFALLFPKLVAGGLYIIEDWRTGYMNNWPDGSPYEPPSFEASNGKTRVKSHDFGMVGWAKSLIDRAAGASSAMQGNANPLEAIEFMHVYKGMIVIRKT